MSERLCYIRRSDRGGVLKGLRLLSTHSDETWESIAAGDPEQVLRSVDEAALWIKDRLSAKSSRNLSALVLDPDGAVCTWVKPEDAIPTMLDAAISQGPIEHDPDELEPIAHNAISERIPRLPRELNFEPLNPDQTSVGARASVMAVPDVPGRLLKDALDALGIRPQRITTIWHALCTAWDPGLGASTSAQRIVSSDAPIAGVVVIDPIDARLIWVWSREGVLICAGNMRLRRVHSDNHEGVVVRRGDIARLCADWLGWSSQLGVSPSRVVMLGEPLTIPSHPQTPSTPSTPDHETSLDPAQMGAMLTQRWPDATLDLMGEPDPIGTTLQRIAQQERCTNLGSIAGLEARPTRTHRSMFRWAALTLTAAAIVIFLLGFEFMSHANAIKAETRQIRSQRTAVLSAFDPAMIMSQIPLMDLQAIRSQIANAQSPISVPQTKPLLKALETVSFVIGAPGIEIEKVAINTRTVTVQLRVDNIQQAEQISSSLRGIDDDLLVWNSSMTPRNLGEKIQVTYLAEWRN